MRLGPLRDVVAHLAVHRRDIDVRAERRVRKGDRHLAEEIAPVSREDGVRPHPHRDVEIVPVLLIERLSCRIRGCGRDHGGAVPLRLDLYPEGR